VLFRLAAQISRRRFVHRHGRGRSLAAIAAVASCLPWSAEALRSGV